MAHTVDEVFPEADPTHTLIDRSGTPQFELLENRLTRGGRIIRLHGPSKVGKTLLCLQILRNTDPIIIYGDEINSRDQFWTLVSGRVGVDVGETPLYCAEQGRPIVIEDFHWVAKNVQAAIIRSFKPLLDKRGKAILISVPDVAQEFLDTARSGTKVDEILGDLLGKSVSIPAPQWRDPDIREIAIRGFKTLRVGLPDWAIAILTRFAFRNPLLMQKHCAELCFVLGIKAGCDVTRNYTPTTDQLIAAFQNVASENGRLFTGIIFSDPRATYELKAGKRVNLATLLLFSVAGVAVNTRVGMPRMQRRIRDSLKNRGSVPSVEAIRTTFEALISDMRKSGQSGLVLDQNNYLHFAHPFFKAYLLWDLVPSCGGELPDLERYVEAEDGE